MAAILSLGDCNMLGVGDLKHQSYPEIFGAKIDKNVQNCGYTMSSTREMIHFFHDFKDDATEIILIQYGLVDSWKTFKYAPYVLYYPDSKLRKFFRKIVKKYKKIAKSIGLNDWLGTQNVVPIDEYVANIEYVIQHSKHCKIFLIDTLPNLETYRNAEIMKYNSKMQEISDHHKNVYKVDVYYDFLGRNDLYLDTTHPNKIGIERIVENLLIAYKKIHK